MSQRRIILSIATVCSLIVPVAAATWAVDGSLEPDNALDTPDFMWQDAPGAVHGRVYFAAMTYSAYLGVGANPNVAALGTNNEPAASEWHEAVLGVWTDCNGDNYIGMAEGALHEYPSTLLLDDSVCPPVSGTPNSWVPGANNYRQLVTEFIPVTPTFNDTLNDKRQYFDPDAAVWGDFGQWNLPPAQRSCTLSPQARGTYQSTGGTLNFIDCRVDILGTWNVVDATAGLGLRFEDADDAENSFADFETGGSEDTSGAAVYVVDCSAEEPMLDTAQEVNGTGLAEPVDAQIDAIEEASGLTIGEGWEFYKVTVDALDPRTGNLDDPKIAGQFNETNEEFFDDCDTSNDRGEDFYGARCAIFCVGEADFNGVDPNHKTEADWNFGYFTVARGSLPFGLLGTIGGSGTAGYSTGLVGTNTAGVSSGRWTSDSTWLSKPGPHVVKTDLTDPENPQAGLADAYWLTFYAYVGPAIASTKQLPGGGATGIYGGPQCGDLLEGAPNGFVCDPDEWYVNPDGTLIPGREDLATVGDPYNLRDSDCYDGNVGAVGVGLYPASYGDNPCP